VPSACRFKDICPEFWVISSCSNVERSRSNLSEKDKETPPFAEKKLTEILKAGMAIMPKIIMQFKINRKRVPAIFVLLT